MVIVIGATSFIGVYTVDAFLNSGTSVVVTGRNEKLKNYYEAKNVKYIKFDLNNPNTDDLPTENVEAIVLLSALLPANVDVDIDDYDNAEDYIKVNTIGTAKLLEFCLKNRIPRLINMISYADVYNHWHKDKPIADNAYRSFKYSGDHAAYVISKNAASDLMEYYNEQHDMKNVIMRLPPVYGVGPHGGLFDNGTYRKSGLQIFMDNAANGDDICVFGDSTISRDVVYVKDVATAIVQATKSEMASGVYNITSGHATSFEEQANVIAEVFANGKQSKVIFDDTIENKSKSYIFDISKAKKDFGYNPKFADFKTMMIDYKKELDSGNYSKLFNKD